MDRFEQKLKNARPDQPLHISFAPKVMHRLESERATRDGLGLVLMAALALSLVVFIVSALANHLGQTMALLFTDFDIVSQYPADFLAAVAETMPWLQLVITFGLSGAWLWHHRKIQEARHA